MKKTHSLVERLAFSFISIPLIYLFGNRLGQKTLEFLAHCIQHLMGIGSGSSVNQSGEIILPQLALKRSSEPYVVLDVGVNNGEFIDLTKKIINEGLVFHGFEPSIECFDMLKTKYKEDSNVILNNFAIGSTAGLGELYANTRGSGSGSMTKPKFGQKAEMFNIVQPIRVETIDGYCEKNKIDQISLLKIDVEGHDLDVLKGAVKMLSRKKIMILSFEFCAAAIETRVYFRDFYEYLDNFGYRIFRITRSGYAHPINTYDERNEIFRTTNFLALHNT